MTYVEEFVSHAHEAAEQFAKARMQDHIVPFVVYDVHHPIEQLDLSPTTYVYQKLSGWRVTTTSEKCYVALESGDILIGKRKLRYRWSKKEQAHMYKWRYFSIKYPDPYRNLDVGSAEILVEAIRTYPS